jgi:hypothetical protein
MGDQFGQDLFPGTEVVASSKPGEKYASLRKKKELVPHKGGIYEQYHRCDGEHPDLF